MSHHHHKKNIHLLLDDYAGRVSEVTATKQYLHHYFVVKERDVAQLLEDVAIEEMHHMEELAEVLAEFGIDPRIWDAEGTYWDGSFVNYQYDVCDILRADITAELEAIEQYLRHIELIPYAPVQKLLFEIIEDEIRHIIWFLEKLEKYCTDSDHKKWLFSEIEKKPFDIKTKSKLVNDLRLSNE
ncbi:bacterioferritin [Desulfitispora alkaliphila]|uniref:ferritin-like domain-containing protein n=1 Tax=Desulfitispora alkaliphila TaxID=622674 RepID=UPI003D25F570